MKRLLFITLPFAIGLAVGLFANGINKGDEHKAVQAEVKKHKAISDKGDVASIAALRARIAELEKALAKFKSEAESNASDKPAEARQNGMGDFRRGESPHERMERMKKEDPARYAQHTNRMARMRQQVASRQQETLDFLASVDVSRLSDGAKKVHEDLQDMIVKRDEIASQLQQEGITDDERHQLWQEMHSINRQIRDLNASERSNLIEDTARNLGLEGDDAKKMSEGIQQVIDATDDFKMFRGAHIGPPPDGPRGGGRP